MKQVVLFLLISAAVTAAMVGVYWWIATPRPLESGTSIVFEFSLPSDEVKLLEAKLSELNDSIAKSSTEAEKKTISELILRVRQDIELAGSSAKYEDSLALDMIDVLRKRLGARGLQRLEWRPIGRNRFEVRMPPLPPAAQKARDAYVQAIKALADDNVDASDLRKLENGETTVAELAKGDKPLTDLLSTFLSSFKLMEAADNTNRQQRISDWEWAESNIVKNNIKTQKLQNILSGYVNPSDLNRVGSDPEALSLLKAKRVRYHDALRQFIGAREDNPERTAKIQRIIRLYETWADIRKGTTDPSDLVKLITRSGALEFRIAPISPQSSDTYSRRLLTKSERDKYVKILGETLDKEGPKGLTRRTDRYLWFPIRGRHKTGYSRTITSTYHESKYILLSNYKGGTLLQRPGKNRWALSNAYMTSDSRDLPAVGFSMNEAGAELLEDLTSGNMGEHMAILLDDEVLSAPVIQAAISSSGIITMGSFDSGEVSTLIEILRAGVLPARLKHEPISITPF